MIGKNPAPGGPGIVPHWTRGAKDAVGTAYAVSSRVWYTMASGVITEVYYPTIDTPQIRDLQFLVTDGETFFHDERRHMATRLDCFGTFGLGFKVTNTDPDGRYSIEKVIIGDPHLSCLLVHTKFNVAPEWQGRLQLFVLCAPHMQIGGYHNNGLVKKERGRRFLMAYREDAFLTIAATAHFCKASCGYVGVNDGWTDLSNNFEMNWEYDAALDGNIALTAEIDLSRGTEFTLGVGFGHSGHHAGATLFQSLSIPFDLALENFLAQWQRTNKRLALMDKLDQRDSSLFARSVNLLLAHEDKVYPGAMIASLSIPWGEDRGDDDLGGYHLVWPRDMVQIGGGLLAANAVEDARRVLNYLMVTQEKDGHWAQNMWLDGAPYWVGIQMDQTALPILLIDLVKRESEFTEEEEKHFWPMVKKAAGYLIANGPVTKQDRWEENWGFTPFTLAVEISALIIAAEHAELNNEPQVAVFFRETADAWNASIERWCYVKDTPLAKQVGVEGYYVRISPKESESLECTAHDLLTIPNRPRGENVYVAHEIVSPDALAFVRFGLRSAHDPRILNTLKVIDTILKAEGDQGPVWYRYNNDGYGEYNDGNPFNGAGVGRPWPLLIGERAHYEIAAGNYAYAQELLKSMENYANEMGMIPEQVWDAEDIPELELFRNKPTGSAMPLAWAHAEYLKLCRSLKAKELFDMPQQTRQRYLEDKTDSDLVVWTFTSLFREFPKGKKLRLHCLSYATVRWSCNNWQSFEDIETLDSGVGIYYADLNVEQLEFGQTIYFTFYWHDAGVWENTDYELAVAQDKGQMLQLYPETQNTIINSQAAAQ
ncbi:MAG: glycoside hydrolase family 15 protein [Bacteroidia bacterium]